MSTELVKIIPVLESADIARDVAWYKEKAGFELSFLHEKMYAGLYRDERGAIHPQAAEGRAGRLFRNSGRHSGAWGARLHGLVGGAGSDRRLAGSGHRGGAAGWLGRHLPPLAAEDASRRPCAMDFLR